MKRLAAIAFLISAMCISSVEVLAQYEREEDASVPLDYYYIQRKGPGLRKILSKFTFGLSTGVSRTNFKHEITDFSIRQPDNGAPFIFQPGNTDGFSNWFNKATLDQLPDGMDLSPDDGELGFKSKAFQIPLRATLHFEIDRFRIGGGYSFEYTNLGDFEPLTRGGEINSFTPDVSSFFMKKYFGSLGASLYRYDEYILVADLNIGGYSLGNKFDNNIIDRSLFVNVGVAIEREMSEYFRLFVRPSYDMKSFTITMPETGAEVRHRVNAFYLNVGATYRIPDLRKCFLKTCKAQLNHAHGDREYRSRVHPIYKKQNPHYGENYPTLIKYKGKNKKKLNPY